MNAIKFIKDNGVEKAREVLRGSPALECYFVPKYQQYFVDKHGFVYVLGMFGYFTPSLGMTIENLTEHGFQISELKRLVESVDLVEHFGNDLIGAKQLLEFSKDCKTIELSGSVITVKRLKQAIADYEQLFGNTETLELETLHDCDTSPNCKKFDERVK